MQINKADCGYEFDNNAPPLDKGIVHLSIDSGIVECFMA